MKIKIKDESNKSEKIEVRISKIYDEKIKKEKSTCSDHVGLELGEEVIDTKAKVEDKSDKKKAIEEIRELLIPLAIYEAKSTFYKIKIAKVVAIKGSKLAVKGAVLAGKGAVIAIDGAKIAGGKIQTISKNHKQNKNDKGGKNEKK